jgi:glutamyl-tRNA reductase
VQPQPLDGPSSWEIDRRLVVVAKRAFHVAKRYRQQAFLDHIAVVMGCSSKEATAHLHALEDARYLVVRGSGTAALVYAAEQMATGALERQGIHMGRERST